MRIALVLAGMAMAAPALAQERSVVPCEDAGISLTTLVEPVAENSRTFYEGRVILYAVDTVEPVCCSAGVAVVLPAAESPSGEGQCVAVLYQNGIDVKGARASYDPARGLLIEMATTRYNDGNPPLPDAPLRLRIDLRDASVTIVP